jgi:hypothetical protein
VGPRRWNEGNQVSDTISISGNYNVDYNITEDGAGMRNLVFNLCQLNPLATDLYLPVSATHIPQQSS